MRSPLLLFAVVVSLASGCSSQDVPQAHRGQMFDRTGIVSLWMGGVGFTGPILEPGTYFTGLYDEVRTVECATVTEREELKSLTRDGVQFGIDIYVRYAANCSDAVVADILKTIPADEPAEAPRSVSAKKLYATFVRPALGEAVREIMSPYIANEVNEKRELILSNIRKRFIELMTPTEKGAMTRLTIFEVNLSNMDYPEELDHANAERAVQAVLRDKAIAERARVAAEIETMEMKRSLAEKEGAAAAARIDAIGAALRRNPEFLQFDMQQKMPEIYKDAGEKGNMVIAAPSPSIIVDPRR